MKPYMARLTYKTPDGSWGIRGLDWRALSGLPPLVYGAMHKLMEMEGLVDTLNDPGSEKTGEDLLAMEQLLTMGSPRESKGEEESRWIMERFCRQS